MNSNAGRVAAVVLLVCAAAGCGKNTTADSAKTVNGTAAAGTEKRFPLTGEILRVERERKVLVVKHDEIKDYMPAMTMEFVVGAGDLALAKPGQKIRAEMVAPKEGDFRLEKIWPNEKTTADTIEAGAKRLAEDTHNLGKDAYREIGEAVPDFALYDQNGAVVQGARFRGKQIMLNFIFTRCPVADMCPASTAKMITTQRLAREAGVTNLQLISITLDPAFDTPGVLKEYADVRGIDTSNFAFLTGPEKSIKDLLTQFGVIAQFQGDMLQHTLSTVLIDENGKVAHRFESKTWEPKEFVAKMRK